MTRVETWGSGELARSPKGGWSPECRPVSASQRSDLDESRSDWRGVPRAFPKLVRPQLVGHRPKSDWGQSSSGLEITPIRRELGAGPGIAPVLCGATTTSTTSLHRSVSARVQNEFVLWTGGPFSACHLPLRHASVADAGQCQCPRFCCECRSSLTLVEVHASAAAAAAGGRAEQTERKWHLLVQVRDLCGRHPPD